MHDVLEQSTGHEPHENDAAGQDPRAGESMESEGQECQRHGHVAQHHHPVIGSAVDHPIQGAEQGSSGLSGHQLIHSILIGDCSLAPATISCMNLAGRISNRIQLTTDGEGNRLLAPFPKEIVERISGGVRNDGSAEGAAAVVDARRNDNDHDREEVKNRPHPSTQTQHSFPPNLPITTEPNIPRCFPPSALRRQSRNTAP